MDVVYDQIENEIDTLTKKVQDFKVDSYYNNLKTKLQETASGMMDYDYLSSSVFQKAAEVNDFVRRLSELKSKIQTSTASLPTKMAEKLAKSSPSQAASHSGLYFFLLVCLCIAGYLYLRVNRIQKKTHIL